MFRMMSYADNFEDVLIQRAFPMDSQGFYIDVGAYNPTEHSVTKHFYDRGWRGINVEPNPAPFAKLEAGRPRDINLNIGLSDHAGQMAIYEAPGACWSVNRDMLTGYFAANPADVVERTIAIQTLAEICDQHVPAGTTIDFLKIDVEGHEGEVIAGNDWTRYRPRIVLAEAFGFEAWEGLLLAAGYHFTLFEGVNRVYVRDEDAHLIPQLSFPANPSDSFSIYGYVRRINELEHELREKSNQLEKVNRLANEQGEIEPGALTVAHHFSRASRRFPRVSKLARTVARRLTRHA